MRPRPTRSGSYFPYRLSRCTASTSRLYFSCYLQALSPNSMHCSTAKSRLLVSFNSPPQAISRRSARSRDREAGEWPKNFNLQVGVAACRRGCRSASRRPTASGRLSRPEQAAHEVAQRARPVAGNDPRLGPGWRHHEPAQLDDLPRERVPLAPGFPRLLGENPAHHLGHRAEHERDAIGEGIVAQHIPAREPAHDRRAESEDDAPDPGFADAEGAHRARLDIRIKRAVGKPGPAEEFARLRDRDDFRMARNIPLALGNRRD